MAELLNIIRSYNLFNYLLPGVVFAAIASSLTKYVFIQDDLFVGAFVYYFIGLIISRVGSVIVEPALKKFKFVEFCSYRDYVSASKEDELIKILSEANNMYRTFISLFMCLFLVKLYELTADELPVFAEWKMAFLVIGLLVLFSMSYRKQTSYVNRRVYDKLPKD